jgi:hypothetical protein
MRRIAELNSGLAGENQAALAAQESLLFVAISSQQIRFSTVSL